jgi:hypothetical protein
MSPLRSARRLAALLLIPLLLAACSAIPATVGSVPPTELLFAMVTPDGTCAVYTGAPGDHPSLDASQAGMIWGSTLHGTATSLPAWELLQDYAVAFSLRELPAEYAVFLCASSRDTATLATLCLDRIAALRAYWEVSSDENAPQALAALDAAAVRVCGRYVLCAVHPDAESLLTAAQKALGAASYKSCTTQSITP